MPAIVGRLDLAGTAAANRSFPRPTDRRYGQHSHMYR
jgi:hypothetical protein